MPEPAWETVHLKDEFRDEYHHLKRFAVQGGWLYHSAYIHNYGVMGRPEHLSCHLTFVPGESAPAAPEVVTPILPPPPPPERFIRRNRPTTGDAA